MSKNNKKILLIADVRNWAFDNIAQYLKPLLESKYEVNIIYTGDYKSLEEFFESIENFKDLYYIHFFYREFLNRIIEYIAINKVNKSSIAVLLRTPMSTSVPDHLFINNDKDIKNHRYAFFFVEQYYTTSTKLLNIYENILSYPSPWHKPIFDNILVQSTEPDFKTNDKIAIAWIGNSDWGLWYYDNGYDPKGYYTVFKPAVAEIEKLIPLEVLVANSAEKKCTKEEVFNILKKSDILVITADTEGTPLPLIEAMSCGCAIVTTDNGIARDVLPKIQWPFILEKEPKGFVDAIIRLNQDRDLLLELKKQNYHSFKEIFLNEKLFRDKWIEFIEATVVAYQKQDGYNKKLEIINARKLNKTNLLLVRKFVLFCTNSKIVKKAFKVATRIPIVKIIVTKLRLYLDRL